MPRTTREDFELETGLADDFDGLIVGAYFGVKSEYAAIAGTSDPMIMLQLENPEFEQPVEQGWACGGAKQWEIGEGGKEIVSGTRPESHRFNMNSRAGKLVTAMFELVGGGNKVKGQEFFQKRDKFMTESGFYTDLNFHWKRVPMTTVSGESRDVLMPNAYLGEVKTAAKATAPTKEVSGDLVDKVIALAEGKTARELKQTVVKELDKAAPGYKEIIALVLSGKLIEDLKAQDKLTEGPDGKFI